MQRNAQKRSGSAQGKVGHLFGKIFQTGQRPGTALNLIEDDKILMRIDAPVEVELQFVENPFAVSGPARIFFRAARPFQN
jgi:hypothetical protein